MPLMALGFNHRAEAFYRCHADSPDNQNVMDAKERGLRKVRVLHWATPEPVLNKVVALLNSFHEGSAENHFDVMQEATPVSFLLLLLFFLFVVCCVCVFVFVVCC